jgi:hypothetical protein
VGYAGADACPARARAGGRSGPEDRASSRTNAEEPRARALRSSQRYTGPQESSAAQSVPDFNHRDDCRRGRAARRRRRSLLMGAHNARILSAYFGERRIVMTWVVKNNSGRVDIKSPPRPLDQRPDPTRRGVQE